MPVVSLSWAGISPVFKATGLNPFDLYHCTIRSSPWLVNIFAVLTSFSDMIGFFENS
jgi:hypothetical protein